jgi:uncharacterized damage-inducible protein DinB
MDLLTHFQSLARYNRIANERLLESCAALDSAEYRKPRRGSFGSIHGLMNHILLGDRIWMSRFQGGGSETPPLDQILFSEFSELRDARKTMDAQIEAFFERLSPEFLDRSLHYTNRQAKTYSEEAGVAVSHFFNHQTHHRGQIHVMLSQAGVTPPSLDLHRILNP